jgi:hypothetical protein
MKINLRKIVSALLVLSILFIPAALTAEARASDYITNTAVGISKSGLTITVDYSITGTGNMTSIGASSIVIYKNSSPVYTFSYPAVSALRSSNTYVHSSSVRYTGTTGNTYYAVVNFYAGNSNGSDTRARTTVSMTL